ncbi:hypothetical protein [Sandarakinorhabdus sp.]
MLYIMMRAGGRHTSLQKRPGIKRWRGNGRGNKNHGNFERCQVHDRR